MDTSTGILVEQLDFDEIIEITGPVGQRTDAIQIEHSEPGSAQEAA